MLLGLACDAEAAGPEPENETRAGEPMGVEPPEEERRRRHRTRAEREHKPLLIGAKFTGLIELTERLQGPGSDHLGRTLDLGGVFFIETALIKGWLELEVASGYFARERGTHSGWVLPVDVLFKKLFFVTEHFNPYVGIGPAFALERTDGLLNVAGGLAAVGGTYLWFGRTFGIDVDLTYSALFGRERAHEFGLAVGPVVHF